MGDTLVKAADVPAYAEEVSHETAILFKSVWEGLDKIWKAYKQNSMPGWMLDDFIDMMTEFQIIERIKPVIAPAFFMCTRRPRKIWSRRASPSKPCSTRWSLSRRRSSRRTFLRRLLGACLLFFTT